MNEHTKRIPCYDIVLAAAGSHTFVRPRHFKRMRKDFERALNTICEDERGNLEQENQDWWRQQEEDALSGNLGEWTDEL